MKKYDQFFNRLIPLHELHQRKILIAEEIDLNEFLDYTQKELILVRTLNSHEFTKGRFDNGIIAREKLQNLILKLIELKPIQSNSSHRERALAHQLKVEFKEAEVIPRKEQKPKKFEQAFDSLNPKTKSKTNPYRAPTQKEIEKVILLLEGFPEVQQKAQTMLQKTNKDKE